jgi:succinate dehydrogenase / fumarate reductase, cytochrome b subunit
MAKSALLKSSIAKKYWMALTGLFLCLFLVGHLIGNLQLIFADAKAFNDYAVFMTTNPAVKVLSYLTYASIVFHAIDGIWLTVQNQKARPVKYVMNKPGKNTVWASRNMAVLGTVILIFIVTHMVSFWARMHFDEKMPLASKEVSDMGGMQGTQKVAIGVLGSPNPMFPLKEDGTIDTEILKQYKLTQKDVTTIVDEKGEEVFKGTKDLHKITVDFFKQPEYGLLYTILYVISMVVLAFHLYHGFGSAFQSLGANNPKYNGFIRKFGYAFSILVPALFAIIPLYIHFLHK